MELIKRYQVSQKSLDRDGIMSISSALSQPSRFSSTVSAQPSMIIINLFLFSFLF